MCLSVFLCARVYACVCTCARICVCVNVCMFEVEKEKEERKDFDRDHGDDENACIKSKPESRPTKQPLL